MQSTEITKTNTRNSISGVRVPDSKFAREIKVKADVLADKDPKFVRGNFCQVIRISAWSG
jgi:hypothetical protein